MPQMSQYNPNFLLPNFMCAPADFTTFLCKLVTTDAAKAGGRMSNWHLRFTTRLATDSYLIMK